MLSAMALRKCVLKEEGVCWEEQIGNFLLSLFIRACEFCIEKWH